MACFYPLPAYRVGSGKPTVGYNKGGSGEKLELPCGTCIGCRLERRRSWTIRSMHEAQLWDSNLFVTLDYAPKHLKSWSLEYRDFQLFMKRLRKAVRGVSQSPTGNYPIRFFCSGEYGAQFQRPHFHAILYNADFKDAVRLHNDTYRSAQADKLWGKGNVVIGAVTPRSAAYVAGYSLEKVYGGRAESHYECVDVATGECVQRRPEFCVVSRSPGLGAWWYEKYSSDLFGSGKTSHDVAVIDGKSFKVPRYYMDKLKVSAPEVAEEIAYARYLRAQAMDPVESSEERREVRAEVARLNVAAFCRTH